MYKTAMCIDQYNTGDCPRGINCAFAHSKEERRKPNDDIYAYLKAQNKPIDFRVYDKKANDKKKKEFLEKLTEFKNDASRQRLDFPASLNSFER